MELLSCNLILVLPAGGDGSPLSSPLHRRRQHQLLPCRGCRNTRKVPIRCHLVPISAILDLPTIKGQAFWDGLGFVLQMLGLFVWICDVGDGLGFVLQMLRMG
jgi:hypothetical protein